MKRNYIVTGANGQLGYAISKYLIEEKKSNVICVTRSSCNLTFDGKYNHIKNIDLLDEHSLNELVQKVEKCFNSKFHVINAVGYYEGQQRFEETDILEADKIMQLNYTTVYNTANKLTPLQIKLGGGHFLMFSCDSTNYFYPHMAPFIAAKSALNALTKCLANEYFKYNIFSNSFSLTTLDNEKERRNKPYGDFKNWLNLTDIAEKVYEFTKLENLVSGNLIKLYNYSDSFFNESYFDRIRK